MKKLLFAFAALLASVVMSEAADAIDVPPVAPAAPTVSAPYDWSGFYIGVQAGYEFRTDDVQDPIPPFRNSFGFDGAVLGGHIGYDQQLANGLVLGVVGDFEWAGGSAFSSAFGSGNDVFARAEANWQGSVRARAGLAADKTLFYATGGLAVGNFDLDYTCCFLGGPPVFSLGDQFTKTLAGYTVGGGVAYAYAPDWIIWSDYRFTDYNTATNGIVNCCAGAPNRQEHDITIHAVRVGLSRKF